ncbi:nucleotidyltransferase family protein [Glaciimonas immobilis]|uniref:Putative nucleotidyltransferase n=1 Tax=Glaciimonas immobilis TaxID=728004 RepID=A0A840RYI2_9BURK|nr:nucleotidyltransferase domain-containing protein [Glaciimonas immobilis]KAF3995949.1 nucleotidyltransferase domain-containing protein [Glaciimonas immobilis]MBB5202603.1 putative nucleotidyltransferase [Glaciimonas immobilis]
MQTLENHPLDVATAATVKAFMEKVTAVFPIQGAILFGSRARGSFLSDSDADIAVLLSGAHGQFVATKMALSDMAFDVMLDTGIRVEAIPVWEDEWASPDTYRNPFLLKNIARDGIIIE